MLKRIFNWFAEGQAPTPDVLVEDRGVDWDAWRKAADRVEWKDARPMSPEELEEFWDLWGINNPLSINDDLITNPAYEDVPGNVYNDL